MQTNIVLTLTGPDRVGIVEQVTRALLELGGNVETSRMARLGGEFAILMLVTLPAESLGRLDAAFEALTDSGYKLTTSQTAPAAPADKLGCRTFRIEVEGADHEGIVHEIARGLSESGINIESAETGTVDAAWSGATLFTMTAVVSVPADRADSDWMDALQEAAAQSSVDVAVSCLEGRSSQ